MYDYFSKGHRYETELSFVITTYCMLACMFLTDINLTNYDVTRVSGMLRFPPRPFWIKTPESWDLAAAHLVGRRRLQVRVCPVTETSPVWLGFVEQRNVVCCRRLETVTHVVVSFSDPRQQTRYLLLKLPPLAVYFLHHKLFSNYSANYRCGHSLHTYPYKTPK